MECSNINFLLEIWRDWMQQDSTRLGFPKRSLFIASGGAASDDTFDILCEESDASAARTMNAIINSISLPQRTAINHAWLKVEHHYPTQDLDYELAIENIIKLCKKRGLTD